MHTLTNSVSPVISHPIFGRSDLLLDVLVDVAVGVLVGLEGDMGGEELAGRGAGARDKQGESLPHQPVGGIILGDSDE